MIVKATQTLGKSHTVAGHMQLSCPMPLVSTELMVNHVVEIILLPFQKMRPAGHVVKKMWCWTK